MRLRTAWGETSRPGCTTEKKNRPLPANDADGSHAFQSRADQTQLP
jgi:hypothetical protein